jgi:hypothetical protein
MSMSQQMFGQYLKTDFFSFVLVMITLIFRVRRALLIRTR